MTTPLKEKSPETKKATSQNNSEKVFLEGPRSRLQEFIFSVKVLLEFIRGFRVLHFIGPCVAVFGSARVKESSVYYKNARKWDRALPGLDLR